MKSTVWLGVLCYAAGSLLTLAEGAKDDVVAAAKKLAEAPCYSWKTTIDAGANAQFRPGPTEGKTIKGGATWVQVSMRDNTAEFVVQGGKAAVKTEDGWKAASELTADGGGGGGGGFNMGRMLARQAQNFKSPAVLAEEVAAKVKDLMKTEDIYSGELTEEGAKSLMTMGFGGRRGGGNGPNISGAKGTAKFWVKEGAITKVQTHVMGTRKNQNGDDVEIDRTTTTEISAVGSTKIDLADDAKKVLQ